MFIKRKAFSFSLRYIYLIVIHFQYKEGVFMNKKGCPEEYPITLIVNGNEVAVFQLTNQDLEDWAYGYLFGEGLIENKHDIQLPESRWRCWRNPCYFKRKN